MSPLFQYFLKIFSISYIAIILLISGSQVLNAEPFNGVEAFGSSFTMAFFLAFSCLILTRSSLKKIGITQIQRDDLKVFQTQEIASTYSLDELLCKVQSDPVFGKSKISKTHSHILLKSQFNGRSFGEKVEIKVLDAGRNKFQISSKPRVPTTLADFGQNKYNIIRLQKLMS